MPLNEDLLQLHDTLLAHYGPQGWWPGDTMLEIMVGAVLTQNTAWKNVAKAIANLKQAGALELPALSALPPEELARLIRPAGYYNLKAGRLKNLLQMIEKRYGGDLDLLASRSTGEIREALYSTKGIGPETADSILLYALDRPVFVVDAYTFRILGRHGLADGAMGYFELQELFSDHLPENTAIYGEFHALLVRLGHDRCRKTNPGCDGCPAHDWVRPPELEEF